MEVKSTSRKASAGEIAQISARMYEKSMKSIEKLAQKRKEKANQKQVEAKTAPVDQIIEISERMFERSKRSIEKLEEMRKKRVSPDAKIKDEKCTFKPNTYKAKYNKAPEGNTYKSKVNLKIKPLTQAEKAQKLVKKPLPKVYPEPFKRMSQCLDWDQKKKLSQTTQYFETEIQKSLEKAPRIKRTSSTLSQASILNKSLQSVTSEIAGTSAFLQRQRNAKLMKQSKEFLLQNPTSHTWSLKKKLNSSADTFSSRHLDSVESVYSKYKYR